MKRLVPLALLYIFASFHTASAEWRTLLGPDSADYTDYIDLFFLNADTGWVSIVTRTPSGAHTNPLLRTYDGGRSWDTIPQTSTRRRIFFVDTAHGWSWSGALDKTTDGGRTWSNMRESIPVPVGGSWYGPEALWFVNRDTGWIVGGNEGRIGTTDGGLTWDTTHVDWEAFYYFQRYSDVQFIGERHGWAVGGDKKRLISRTTDGGRTWIDDPSNWNASGDLTYLSVFDTTFGAALDPTENDILVTTDGGATWTWSGELIDTRVAWMTDIAVVDSTTLWVAGEYATPNDRSLMMVSHDRGSTWTIHDFPGIWSIHAITFPTPERGYAAGSGGLLVWEKSTGVTERPRYSQRTSLDVTPNPHHGKMMIAIETDAAPLQLEIIDLQGRVLRTKSLDRLGAGSHRIALDLDGLPSGAYVVRLVTSAGSAVAATIVSP